MITFDELKALIIKSETSLSIWGDVLQEEEFELYVKGIENEVNKCNSIGAIISFYDRQGYDTVDAYNIILDTVMNNSTLNK
jgi:hypothetical protein